MDLKNKITIIHFSSAFTQKDVIESKSKKIIYYDTQKGALINQIIDNIKNVSIDLIGLNDKFVFNVDSVGFCNFIKIPHIKNPLLSLITFNLISLLSMILRKKPSLVYVYSNGESCYYFGALLYAKLLNIPLFYSIRNPPEYLVSFNKLTPYKQIIVSFLDRTFLKFSDKIIHISKKSKNLLKLYPELYEKSIVMASCSNDLFLKFDSKNDVINSELKFAYWGVIDETRDLDIIIHGFFKAKKLSAKFEAKLYLFGDGHDLDRLKKLVSTLNISDIFFCGYMEQERLIKYLTEMSVAIISIPKKDIFQYSSPIKLAEAVSMNLPIIASNIEPNLIVKEQNLGILCNHDVDGYAQAFLKFGKYSSIELTKFSDNCKEIKYIFSPEYTCAEVIIAIRSIIKDDI